MTPKRAEVARNDLDRMIGAKIDVIRRHQRTLASLKVIRDLARRGARGIRG